MAIELSVETQKRIEEKLKSGRYSSADELICAALDALNEFESEGLDEETLKAIERSDKQIERGEFYDWKDVRARVLKKFLED